MRHSRKLMTHATTRLLVLLLTLSCAMLWLTNSAYMSGKARQTTLAQADSSSIRQITLPTNDLVYDKNTGKIYASVPSVAGAGGNSLTPIDPATGAIGTSVFIGSEPNKLAISDNGQYIYAGLDGAYAVRRFDVASQTAGLQFSVGRNSSNAAYKVYDLAVTPGNAQSIAVSRITGDLSGANSVAIYDNDIQRQMTAGSGYIEFSSSDALFASNSSSSFGSSGSLQKYSVTASGLTAASSTPISTEGADFRISNGRIYTSAGKVFAADTGALLGTFPDISSYGTLVVPDSSVGRVYFLSGGNSGGTSTLTLRAYDMNTFVLVGTLSIPNVNGLPGGLVRWGANGLAFRTGSNISYNGIQSGNQVYLIQTSLIPSSEPIPPAPSPTPAVSPTPTPSPTPFESNLRQVSLPTRDIIFDPSRQTIYASVPSVAGAGGNSITPINPATGTVGSSVFIGSEPGKLALSDNGQYLYAGLDGANAVRRVDLTTQTAGLQISLGNNSSYSGSGVPAVFDLEVLPGNPESIAVSRNLVGITIYDNNVARPTAVSNSNNPFIEFSPSAATLYGLTIGYSGQLQKISVTSSGATVASSTSVNTYGDFQYDNGRIYIASGQVLDAETGTPLGGFSGLGNNNPVSVVSDSTLGRVFFLSQGTSSSGTQVATIRAYDQATFLPLGTLTIPNISTTVSSLVRWGANGLAFRTGNTSNGSAVTPGSDQVFLIQSTLVSPSAPVPTVTPSPAPTPSPVPTMPSTDINQLTLNTNDLIYNPATQLIYVSVPGNVSGIGNSLTAINPATATIGSSVFIGSEPNKLAISDNGQYIYAGLDGANSVRRFDTTTQTAGLQFGLNNGTTGYKAFDLAVLPGRPTSVAVSKTFGGSSGLGPVVAVYDDSTQRPTTTTPSYTSAYIEFSASAATLYSLASSYGNNNLQKLAVTDSGLTVAASSQPLIIGDFRFDSGRIYLPSGQVVDPETGTLVGTFTNFSSNYGGTVVAPDSKNGRVYFVSQTAYNAATLRVYDMRTFLPIGSVAIPGITGAPASLVRWGTNGLAFRTLNSSSGNNLAGSQVFLIRSALIDPTEKIASSIKFSASVFNGYENAGLATITVNRFGDNASAASVDYATSNGTATDNRDYTLASGTLTFAPGETSKTFTVLITDDVYPESSETINLTLSNVVGATLGTPSASVLTIIDNDSGTPTYNPIDFAQFFVRQQYSDFLNRAPDTGGLNYWTALITKCASNDTKCINTQRVSVSAAFFIEQEFQDTGSFVYRFYKASYGQSPTYAQFMPDRGRVVGGANLEAGKQAFADAWVQRPEFLAKYPQSLTGTQFIEALLATVKQGSGVDLSSQRDALIADFNANGSRSRIVRQIADNQTLQQAEYNNAFVLMQYFGYLRRDPDADGYKFWLDVLNNRVANNYRAMVCAFITSAEYQDRFSPVRTRNDSVCGSIGQ